MVQTYKERKPVLFLEKVVVVNEDTRGQNKKVCPRLGHPSDTAEIHRPSFDFRPTTARLKT